ncbi:MAG: glycoside hydrolase family 38 C-terminal domain-containing protein, partial [Candidatus Hodarchaeota archaeon]
MNILKNQSFHFTFDGQTIILEDYLEIRPENKEELLQFIREGKIAIGPWYLLPDIWLVGQESLIRNLEYSYDLAKDLEIPLMQIGYLPDMFGHSRAIPQIIGDLTSFKAVIVWRGVPPEITTVPFNWKSDISAKSSILAIYLPFGYGNAAMLPEETDKLTNEIMELVEQLKPYSPLPVYLLHNGTDHQFPNPKIAANLSLIKLENMQISLSVLDDYVLKLQELINHREYSPPEYVGELRSAARAHLLQDTYSSRIWIKQWNQKIEDILVNYAEPLNAYTWYYLNDNYPASFLSQAWKWHLRNQPHDSICGCSIDQTHEEMRFRYYWAESIAEMTIENAISTINETSQPSIQHSCLGFNPTNCSKPIGVVFNVPRDILVHSVKIKDQEYEVQPLPSSTRIVWEMTLGRLKLRTLMNMLPGRRLMNYYVNKTSLMEGPDPEICEVLMIVGDTQEGELDMREMKKELLKVIDSKKYKKFHILVTKEYEKNYFTWAPIEPWSFTKIEILDSFLESSSSKTLTVSKDRVSNDFYDLIFNQDGTFDVEDKINNMSYRKLHQFEDWGDRGDEYTFGRLGPEFVKVNEVKRSITLSGPLLCEIQQKITLEVFQEADESGEKRIGERKIPVNTSFRFYRDSPLIDMKTTLTNVTKDHRLRICFDLPFKTEHTLSSTHFGCIKRPSYPVGDETYIEKPSGIQPQKRYIRVDDQEGQPAFSLVNKGLPEVELENGRRLALTLVRSIGWLSRSGIPERPEHAGPRIATPGAQELNETYTFEYGLV